MALILKRADGNFPRSTLPSGGSPALDAAYLAWRDGFVREANDRALDRHDWTHDRQPVRGLIEAWKYDEALYLASGGSRLYESPTYAHRLRFLAVELHDHPRAMRRLADQYAATKAADYEAH